MKVKKIWDLTQFHPEKMQKINLFQSSRMFCDIYCFEPGQKQSLHSHEGNDKIYFVLKGVGLFTVGEESRTLKEGESTWATSGEPHGVLNNSQESLVCLVFMAPHPRPSQLASPTRA